MSTLFLKSKTLLDRKNRKVSSVVVKFSKLYPDLSSIKDKEILSKYNQELEKASNIDKDNIEVSLSELIVLSSSENLVFNKYSEFAIYLSSLEDSQVTYVEDKITFWNLVKDFFTKNKDWQIIVSK